jgi:purine-nucleoside phosphorylase
MDTRYTTEQIDTIVKEIQSRLSVQPKIAMILGSGLGPLSEEIENPTVIHYQDLPVWPSSTVEGHAGNLVIGQLEGQDVLVMNGRLHFYEGYSMQQVTLPIRVMKRLGIETLIVTNAAGGVNQSFEPGNPMLIVDHINLPGMTGMNPLRGPNLDEFGPRFPDMSQAYDRALKDLVREVAQEEGVLLYEGVYICLSGPTFETPAELRFLKTIGADAVGMSTAPEVTVARHSGLRVVGISGITNKGSLDGNKVADHEEVIETGKILAPKMMKLLRGLLQKI